MRKILIIFNLSLLFIFIIFNYTQAAGGDLIWSRADNWAPMSFWGIADIVVDDSGVYAVGDAGNSSGCYSYKEQKRDLNGNLIWSRSYPNACVGMISDKSVAVDSTSLYVEGDIEINSWYMTYAPLFKKINKNNGNIIWQKTESTDEYINDIAVSASGFYAVGGTNNIWRIEKRTLNGGNLIWVKNFIPPRGRGAIATIDINNTGIYIGGSDSDASGNTRWYVQKRDFNGNIIWSFAHDFYSGSNDRDQAGKIIHDNTNIYVSGFKTIDSSNFESVMFKLDSSTGNLLKTWNISNIVQPLCQWGLVEAVDSGGVYIAGFGYIFKTNLNIDQIIWQKKPSLFITHYYIASDALYDGYIEQSNNNQNFRWRLEKREKGGVLTADCGLRVYDGNQIVKIACEPAGTLTSPLRIYKNGVIYGIVLVDVSDASASNIRIKTPAGIKALRKY